MNKIATAAIVLSTAVLSACGTRTVVVEQTPDTQVEVPQTAAPQPVDREQQFLNGVTADYPTEVSRLGKVGVLQMGRLTCDAIDEGSTLADFVDMAQKSGVDAGFIGSLIREAVHNFCPENQWFIDSALNSGGA
jgi:hypothetical protein